MNDRSESREEQFCRLAREFLNLSTATAAAKKSREDAEREHSSCVSREENAANKLREFVGRNVRIQQTVVGSDLVRVEHVCDGNIKVTAEKLL